ncbi:MAG: hypothetical protein ABW221_12640 [Vicinamibacteria bacterium]
MPVPFTGVHVRRWTIAALLTLAALLCAQPARACSCSGEFTQKSVDQAVAVFAGTVTDVQFLEPDAPRIEPKILVTFDVSEIWKGPQQGTLRLRTVFNKFSCSGEAYQRGDRYFVVTHKTNLGARKGEVELEDIYACTGTRRLDQATDSLKVLGRPGWKPPKKDAAS